MFRPLLPLVAAAVLFFASLGAVAAEKAASEYLDDAKAQLSQGKVDDALQSLSSAITMDPQNYLSRFRRAAIFLSQGRDTAALEDLTAALAVKPDFDQALMQRAKIKMKRCALDDAVTDLELLRKHGSDVGDVNHLMTEIVAAKGNISTAAGATEHDVVIAALTAAMATCSHDSELRLKRAEAYKARGDISMAIGDYTRASQLAPDNLKTMLLITELHLKLGDVDMAVHSVKSCLHSDPENKHCSRLFRKTKKLVKLMEKIESMLEKRQCRDALNDAYLDPERRGKDSAQSLMSELGVEAGLRAKVAAKTCHCLVQTKNTEGARQWCDDAVALNPDDADALCDRAESRILAEDFDAALHDYNKAAELSNGSPSNRVREGIERVRRLIRQAKKKDYYKILGVSRDASLRDIKKAYRKKAVEYHPDKANDKEAATKKMSEINSAYEVLSNEELRQKYDMGEDPNDPESGHGGGHPFGGHGHPVFFQGSPFGGFGGGGQHFSFRYN